MRGKTMSSVAGRIAKIRQPRGGYIKPSQFSEVMYEDGEVLKEENVHSSIIGMAVDYLTRYVMGMPIKDAFEIPIKGYFFRKMLLDNSEIKKDKKNNNDISSLLNSITGLDDISIISACKAVTYDVWLRKPTDAIRSKGAEETNPDVNTIHNIRVMVNRSVSFWEKYGPIIASGFTFEDNGYTETVDSGDGDYLTKDTLWDFKVSKSKPKSKHTLQVLMYWIMGLHSGKPEFKTIKKLGFFNPRLNTVYLLDTNSIPNEVITTVEQDVICYN